MSADSLKEFDKIEKMDGYSLAFSLSNLGPKRFQLILQNFKDVERAWSANELEYQKIGIQGRTLKKFSEFREKFAAENYLEKLQRENVYFVSFLEKEYPQDLKKLENPPIGLFAKGNVGLLKDKFAIAVVGTRKITAYGRNVTENLVEGLVANGACIVSGLALGVDGIAHKITVSNKGSAIAVLACGVDCCLPSENYSLYSDIIKNNGVVISEYPLSQPPNKGTFLARNRIVAALSDGVLITEAAVDSGSLVTANWGFKLGKKVFAVPGPITSRMSDGSLKLLKQGAHLATRAEDILEEFNSQKTKVKSNSQMFKNLSKEEKKIVSLLHNESMTIDEISKNLQIQVSELFVVLSGLELKGVIKNRGGKISLST